VRRIVIPMKRNLFFLALLFASGFLFTRTHRAKAIKPVAVIELFTSQGCSSCPPADRLLTEISKQAIIDGQEVYALSFHVDYWNRLGWKDPYSNHQYTARQQRYAQLFGLGTIYTPQAVLNGNHEFVGSNPAKLTTLLSSALNSPASVGVQVSASRRGETIAVNYALTGATKGTLLNVALVSESVSTVVSRGENAGHTLMHNNVVRAFTTLRASETGQTMFTIPADFDLAKGAIVVYVQDEKSLHTLGAGKVKI